ncbi:MAG: hypothetical protein IKQ61_08850 [Spirochaetales bacterium]|nr:hypothetical protein [Spirochaetales bacterium]
MSVLIVYASYHGTTEKAAYRIKENLETDSVIINAEFNSVDDWKYYEKVVIATPVHAGKPHKAIKKFIEKNLSNLADRQIYLVACNLDENWIGQCDDEFPKEFICAVVARKYIGGILKKNTLSGSERKAIETMEKKLNISLDDVNSVNVDDIIAFAKSVTA